MPELFRFWTGRATHAVARRDNYGSRTHPDPSMDRLKAVCGRSDYAYLCHLEPAGEPTCTYCARILAREASA